MKKSTSSQPKKKLAIYDPYLDVMGGGERYLLSIAKALEKDYQINIFWDADMRTQIKDKFSLDLKNAEFFPNIFNQKNLIGKLHFLKNYDIFLYISDGSYHFSTAKKTYVYAMVPELSLMPHTFLDKRKTANTKFITHSMFNQQTLQKWGFKSKVLYPYIDKIFHMDNHEKRDQTILSVGRFFSRLHTKRQDLIIDTFKLLKQQCPAFKEFKLILAGGLKEEDKSYFDSLQKIIDNRRDIEFKPNIGFSELLSLYGRSRYFWHFSGYGIDQEEFPHLVEHLGITPLEAMAAGCIVSAYGAGGPAETIKNNNTGFLFTETDELIKQMAAIENNPQKQKQISKNAQEYVRGNFNLDGFVKNVKKVLDI